jgi:hypothetical protein
LMQVMRASHKAPKWCPFCLLLARRFDRGPALESAFPLLG